MKIISEIKFEELFVDELAKSGWDSNYNFERQFWDSAFDWKKIEEKIEEINNVDKSIVEKAIFEIKKISGSALEQNIEGFNFLLKGIKVFNPKNKRVINIKLVSSDLSQNHYGVVRQLPLIDKNGNKRFPDIVCFLNGFPIIISEIKSAISNESLEDAFKQNNSLKKPFPSLYRFNIFNFVSNNIESRYGSITSSIKTYFSAGKWNEKENPIQRIFTRKRILDFITLFSFFDNSNKTKYIAGLHQINAVEKTIEKMNTSDHKGGVVWHTQGSGKSVTMLMLSRAIIKNYSAATILMITDRNSLDRQLFARFNESSEYLYNKPIEVDSRKDLIEKLNAKERFGIYFTTIQKFSSQTKFLSNRDDIFVLIDEAHRTQNNIDGDKVLDKKTKEFIMKYGFARYMRDAFPKAILTGFTGTPLMKRDKATIDIFGGYNHIYSMSDSVADKSTVPIYYESRKVNIILNKKHLREMDAIQNQYAKTLDVDDVVSEQKMKTLLKSIQRKKVLEDPDVIRAKVSDILHHLEIRKNVLNGKAMIVVSSRKAAFEYCRQIRIQKPSRKKSTILVMTSNNKDLDDEAKMIVPKHKQNEVATEFKKANSIYKIAIVVDMWLTGFDVPDLDVMYIDKIVKYHNLMQAIARVNRVFEKKESGLIVDYLGIWNYLSEALVQYAIINPNDVDIIPEDIEKAKTKLIDQIDIIDKNFVNNIKNFSQLNNKNQYKFVFNSLEKALAFSKEKLNNFILKSREIKRLTKIAFTKIDNNTLIIAKGIEAINSLLTSKNTQNDEELNLTIEKIQKELEKAIDTKESDVEVKSTNLNRDINEVAKLLEEEAIQIRESNPLVSKKLLVGSINSRIANIKKFRPEFAKKASEKLKKILNKINEEIQLKESIDKLIYLAKEIAEIQNSEPEFKDPHLQAFFTILSDDKYLKRNRNSEVLRKIAIELMQEVKDNITDSFYKNKKVRKKVAVALKILLKNKYNYPPKELGGISGIIIDRINNTIRENVEYFRRKKEIV